MSYKIGTSGQPWGALEKEQWFKSQQIKRLYSEEVLPKLEKLAADFEMISCGQLDYSIKKYPLYAFKTKNWDSSKPTVLVTGGVHGYETSGIHGAIRFLETSASQYEKRFNIVVLPCISPWGYETINRWNPNAMDPNRSFYTDSPADESRLAMGFVNSLGLEFMMHIDLHETTDTDNTEFRPALSARDAVVHENWDIPDGFYLVADSENVQLDFQIAINDAVSKITHIAPADANGRIIGEKIQVKGVISYPQTKLGLCGGFSSAKYKTTTEVYPDSKNATPEECVLAQVAAICGGLDYLLEKELR